MIYNVVFVTAFTSYYKDARDEKRVEECKHTVQSLRKHVPNVFVVVNEGSSYKWKEEELQADKLTYTSVQGLHKSHGDHWLWFSMFSSDWFQTLCKEHDVKTAAKISGRYYLLDNFTWKIENETLHLAKYRLHDQVMVTYYFRFHKDFFPHVLTTCQQIENAWRAGRLNHTDIEHAMFQYNVLDPRFAIAEETPIGVGGWCAGDQLWHEV